MPWKLEHLEDLEIVELTIDGSVTGEELKEAAAARIRFGQEVGVDDYIINVRHIDAPQSTISQHLGVLRREGLVQTRRDAQTLYYSLAGNEARAILETLQALYCPPQNVDA